ncbi:hypothetical protein NFI96_020750 [Prochilodus magdalenae]|nr:hypothetical protein NFI96_020750 [Prochilodus magdalenae]
MEFKTMLLEISRNLSSADLTSLKFLCQDTIGKKKTEDIDAGIQLFEYLIQRGEIGPNDTTKLRELLNRIGRQDFLEVVESYESRSEPADLPDKAELDKINIATDVILEHLGSKWLQFGRKLGLKDGMLDGIEEKHPRNLEEKVREVIKLWKKMRKQQARVDELIKALRGCSQNFTADLVEKEIQNASTP